MKILVSDPITESGMAVLNEAKSEVVNLPKGTTEYILNDLQDLPEIISVQQLHC